MLSVAPSSAMRDIYNHLNKELVEGQSLDAVLKSLLEATCRAMRWQVGEVWIWRPLVGELQLRARWSSRTELADAIQDDEHAAAPGKGLAGRIWTYGKPMCLSDLNGAEDLQRARRARDAGLPGAFGFPIGAHDRAIGVMTFFSSAEPDARIAASMSALAAQIGPAIETMYAHEALRESEARKAAIMEVALDAIIKTDRWGNIIEINPAAERMFGHGRDEVLGKRLDGVVMLPRHGSDPSEPFEDVVERLLRKRLHVQAMRWDGTRFDAELVLGRMHVRDSPLFVAYIRDISERTRYERELREQARRAEEANRRKDEFLRLLGHELRNPLAPVVAALEVMRLEADPDRVARARQVAERHAVRLRELVDDLLDISRVMRGDVTLRLERAEIAEVVRAAIERAGPILEQREHTLTIRMPSPLEAVLDHARVARVIGNLLTNAARFTPPRGRISVDAKKSKDERWLELWVRDTGIGIDPATLPRVFDAFIQGSRTNSGTGEGIGLGLAVVKSLVALHGGSVSAYSDGKGKGTTVSVWLPVDGPESAPPPSRVDTQERRRVLLACNEEDAVRWSHLLRLRGHEVRTAGSTPRALAQASAFQPHVVLVEEDSELIDAEHAFARLRELKGTVLAPELRIIAIRPFFQFDNQRPELYDGAVTRPLRPDDLIGAVESGKEDP